MSDSTRSRTPISLDALLSANRDSFDRLFRQQMAGGRAAAAGAAEPPPGAGVRAPDARGDNAQASGTGTGDRTNAVAELNRRFAADWSAETAGSEVRDGRATVRVTLTAGGRSRTETGSSRIGDDGDEAAIRRAHGRALLKAADSLERDDAATPAAGRGAPPRAAAVPVDIVTVNRVDIVLGGVRHEMEAVLARSALSPMAGAGPSGLAMIADGRGQMVSGRGGSFLGHMLAARKLRLAPGDVLLVGDPFASAGATGSAAGWLVVIPAFNGPDLLGFAIMHGHMSDVGGMAPGSRPAGATSIFAEGMRIPPVKIRDAGTFNQAALDLILANSRTPDANRTDLMALIAACQTGEAGLRRLCARLGAESYHRACQALLERTRDAMRQAIVRAVPEEPQSFEDRIDDDGAGHGPFTLRLTAWREGDHAYFDWTGTSAQAPGPVNFYLHVGLAKAFVGNYLMRAFAGHAPANDGFHDLIHVTLPGGTLLNPDFPAPVGHGEHGLVRHLEVLGSAIDRHEPDRLSAAGCGSVPVFAYSGAGFRMTDPVFGGGAARSGADGTDGTGQWPGGRTTPAEHLEGSYPVVVEHCGAVPGSGGAGLWRGGNAVEKIYRVLEAGTIAIQDDRHASHPWGVNGGRPGALSEKWIERADGGREALASKIDGLPVAPGDRIVFRTAGGGGWGNPLDRDPERVRRDVLAGLLDADAAGAEYGVILHGEMREIDRRATEEFRTGLMRERNRGKLFDRGGPA